MTIEWFRDLVIIIFGLVATGVLIAIAVMSYSVYRRMKAIQLSIKNAAHTIETISSLMEPLKPLLQVAAVVMGVRQGIDSIIRTFHSKERRE